MRAPSSRVTGVAWIAIFCATGIVVAEPACGGRSSLDNPEIIEVLPDGARVVGDAIADDDGSDAVDGEGDSGDAADTMASADGSDEASDGSNQAHDGALIADAIAPGTDASTGADATVDASSSDATASTDAAETTDGSATADAAPHTIKCGTTTCDAETEECCVRLGGGSSCTAVGACTGGLSLSCSSSASCASGDVCCLSFATGASATCQTSCARTGGPAFQLCAGNSECATGERCRATPAGVSICVRAAGAGAGGGGAAGGAGGGRGAAGGAGGGGAGGAAGH